MKTPDQASVASIVASRCVQPRTERMGMALPHANRMRGSISGALLKVLAISTIGFATIGVADNVMVHMKGSKIHDTFCYNLGNKVAETAFEAAGVKNPTRVENGKWKAAVTGVMDRIRDSENGGAPLTKEELDHTVDVLKKCAESADYANSRFLAQSQIASNGGHKLR